MGTELQRIGDQISGSKVNSKVALMLSYDSRFAFEIQPNNPHFSYAGHFLEVYRAFHKQNVSVDIVSPASDLSSYRLVIAPALHVLTERCAEALNRFVKDGGILLVTQRSGVKNEANAVVNQRLPGLLAEVCGVEVEEYDSLNSKMANTLEFTLPELVGKERPSARVLCEILKPIDATVVARYTQEFYAGRPAITLNSYGKGQAIYVGAFGGGSFYETLADWLLQKSGVSLAPAQSDGVEMTERWLGDRLYLFILNHQGCKKTVHFDKKYKSLLDEKTCFGEVQIEPYGVLILTPC